MTDKKMAIGKAIKTGATVAAAAASDPLVSVVLTAVAEGTGIGLDFWQSKRMSELFDSKAFANAVAAEIRNSEDFASFAVDIMQRYNNESSEERRRYLRNILKFGTTDQSRDFVNLTKIISISQEVSIREVEALEIFYSREVAQSTNGTPGGKYRRSESDMHEFYVSRKMDQRSVDELGYSLGQLGNYGLLWRFDAQIGGTQYEPVQFGRVFLSYIKDESDLEQVT